MPHGRLCHKCYGEKVPAYAEGAARRNSRRREVNVQFLREERSARGGCEWPACEVQEVLVWHHVVPEDKLFCAGAGTRSRSQTTAELTKCKLLC